MKRLLLILTLAFSITTISSHAEEIKVNDQVLESFRQSYSNATEISWTTVSNLYKVNCNVNGEYVTIYYNELGKMVSLTRNVSLKSLPLYLQASLKKNCENSWISDLTEVNNEEGIFYVATIENGDNRTILKSTSDADWFSIRKYSK